MAECPACHTQQGTGPCLSSGTPWVRTCQALGTVRGHSRSHCCRLSAKSLQATDRILDSIEPSGSLKALRGGCTLERGLGERLWGFYG